MGAAGLRPVQGLQNSFSLWEVPGWSQGVGKSLIILTVAPLPPPRPQQTPRAQETPLRRQPPLGWRGSPPPPAPPGVRSWRPRLRLWANTGGGGSQRPSGKWGDTGESPQTVAEPAALCFPAAGWSRWPWEWCLTPFRAEPGESQPQGNQLEAGGSGSIPALHPGPPVASGKLAALGPAHRRVLAPPPPTRTKDTEGRASGTEGNAGVRPFWD